MHDHLSVESKKNVGIRALVQDCLHTEQTFNKEEKTLKELSRYLNEFSDHCEQNCLYTACDITADFLHDYVSIRCKNKGPSLQKAVVWSLRKFGNFISLINIARNNPAIKLRHPKFNTRSELPKYLSQTQLQNLLESAQYMDLLEFSMISLMVSTGIRTNETVNIKRKDVYLDKLYFEVKVKGGWIKQTPLSESAAIILAAYLCLRKDNGDALFVNKKGRPVSVSKLRSIIRSAGEKAGIPFSVTPNILRHTFATHAADRNGKVITKALIGHRCLSTTEVYTHLSPGHFKGLVNLHPYNKRR
jgi:integrase/recombinase XerD